MRLNVQYGDKRVGQLLETDKGVYFEYDVLWLQENLQLSPVHLETQKGVFGPFGANTAGLPGMIYDSLPDKWGMEVLRRRFEDEGRPRPSNLGLLAYLGERTMGALSYEPCEAVDDEGLELSLHAAADFAKRIQAHDHEGKLNTELLASAATAGGARPKILVAASHDLKHFISGPANIPEDMQAWLVKLNTGSLLDGPVEAAYAAMARAAGIELPEFTLIEDEKGLRHFAVRRFDRSLDDPNERIHLHSYAGLQHISYRNEELDYSDLFRTTQYLTRNAKDLERLFRRMVFNVLAHNRDDHAKNFAFLMDASGQWHLPPAYDLVFCNNDYDGNWMLINGRRSNINRSALSDFAKQFSIKPQVANQIIKEVEQAVGNWMQYAEKYAVPKSIATLVDTSITRLSDTLNQ